MGNALGRSDLLMIPFYKDYQLGEIRQRTTTDSPSRPPALLPVLVRQHLGYVKKTTSVTEPDGSHTTKTWLKEAFFYNLRMAIHTTPWLGFRRLKRIHSLRKRSPFLFTGRSSHSYEAATSSFLALPSGEVKGKEMTWCKGGKSHDDVDWNQLVARRNLSIRNRSEFLKVLFFSTTIFGISAQNLLKFVRSFHHFPTKNMHKQKNTPLGGEQTRASAWILAVLWLRSHFRNS